jgi:hypothetical protein
VIDTTPGTGLHAFGNRPVTTTTIVMRPQFAAELFLKFTPLQFAPGGAVRLYLTFPLWNAPFAFVGAAPDLAERRVHLDGIAVAVTRIQLDCLSEHFGYVGSEASS